MSINSTVVHEWSAVVIIAGVPIVATVKGKSAKEARSAAKKINYISKVVSVTKVQAG